MKPAATLRRFPLHLHLSVLFSAFVLVAGAAIAKIGRAGGRKIAPCLGRALARASG